MINNPYKKYYSIGDAALKRIEHAEAKLKDRFASLEAIRMENQLKVLKAMQDNGLSQSDFYAATGYGYGDTGREKTEAIFRDVFRAEDALVRAGITSGTHALATVIFALVGHGQTLFAATGHPYDTLQEVIGIKGEEVGTLLERGAKYEMLPLENGKINLAALPEALKTHPRLVLLQRSTGYTNRRAFTIDELGEAIAVIRKESPESIIFVDNCYGEFTETREPLDVGADLIAGSLIKNPGGGIAISGGYIAGRKDLVERCMNHLTAPGIGKDTGLSFGTTRLTLQGLFFAPHVTIEALKGALLFAAVYEDMGYSCMPALSDPRSDIIEAITLGTGEKVEKFCHAVQQAASVGADVLPMPWDMPGYTDPVVMASGGFIDGSSIEVSADGPMREPYIVYYQGGVVYEQVKLACLLTVESLNQLNV